MTGKEIKELRRVLQRVRPDWNFMVNYELERTKVFLFKKKVELGPELINLDVGYRESFIENIFLVILDLEEKLASFNASEEALA